ncbi:MAG: flagellar hook-associated protein FlgK [Planctomycetia bacterium]
MSLFSTIQMAGNSLSVNSVAMQVVGQNISNVNTEGYIREEVIFSPAPTQNFGRYALGMGVEITAVKQVVDYFVEERLRGAVSDLAGSATLSNTYTQLERLIGETTEFDLSTAVTEFFDSISDVLNQPESLSVRHLAALQGQSLSQEFQYLSDEVQLLREHINEQVAQLATEINQLTEEIRKLNVQIAEIEGGSTSDSDAVGLRDKRMLALEELAGLIDIQVQEQPSGTVTVYVDGQYLVADGISRDVEVVYEDGQGMSVAMIQLAETQSPIAAKSGELYGLVTSRDEVLADFQSEFNDYASTLIFEFNKIFSSGQGLSGYTEITSAEAIVDITAALDQAGLDFTPVNGMFEVLVYNEQTGTTERSDIRINLNGIDTPTTLEDVRDQLNAVSGVSASIDIQGHLVITSDDPNEQIAFANDTSYFLAAMGINTFFTGYSAGTIDINESILDDPSKFAASQGGIGVDIENAILLAGLQNQPLNQSGETLIDKYDTMISNVTEGAYVANSMTQSDTAFEETLREHKLSISGVNLDEETLKMMAYQRAYQANSKLISTIDELFDTLLSL